MKKLISILVTVLLFNCTSIKSFSIETIQETNPIYKDQTFRFPLLKEGNKIIRKEINADLIKDFLEVESQSENIFKNVWATKKNKTPSLSNLDFELNLLNENTYSVTLKGEGCGAYCEDFSKSYNYNLKSGKLITLENLFLDKSISIILKQITETKKKRISEHLNALKLESETEDLEEIIDEINLFEYCLTNTNFSSFKYMDFKIEKDKIVINSDRCSNHAMRALDNIGRFEYVYYTKELENYLSEFGKNILGI